MTLQPITKSNLFQLRRVFSLKDCFPESERTHIKHGRAAAATIQFSPDSKVIASLGFDTSLHVFEVNQRKRLYSRYATSPTHFGEHGAISFHPSDPALISDYDHDVILTHYASGQTQVVKEATTGSCAWSRAFSNKGDLWAYQSLVDRTVAVVDYQSGTELFKIDGHTSGITGLMFGPNDDLLVTAGDYIIHGEVDETVRVYDVRSGEPRYVLRPDKYSQPASVAFSPDGSLLAVGYSSRSAAVYLFDVNSGQKIHVIEEYSKQVDQMLFSADGTQLATISWDGSVRLWDVSTGKQLYRWHDFEDQRVLLVGLRMSDDESLLFTAVRELGMTFIDYKTGQFEAMLDLDISYFDLSPDGTVLATGGWDSSIELWQTG